MNAINRIEHPTALFVYWMKKQDLDALKKAGADTMTFKAAALTVCEVMKAKDDVVYHASPAVWSRVCVRQGSWYRSSKKNGDTMVVSAKALPKAYDGFFEVRLTTSTFQPDALPSRAELESLANDPHYLANKPAEWENKGIIDSVMFKILFSVTGFWGIGDNLKKHWVSHRANHANALTHTFTADLDGQKVPYSVTENAGICSSCVEFFNVIDEGSRKLVRACPGAVTFGNAQKKVYYDVNPAPVDGL